MKKIYYHKLIRDRIPEKILKKGSSLETKKLNKKQFEIELRRKIQEEASGIAASQGTTELAKELADLLFVMEELQKFHGIKKSDITKAQKENMKAKGGFKKRLFLVWSSKDDYKTNEKRR